MAAPIAVIFGVGPGTGAALARALAPSYSLLLMSRSLPGSLSQLGLNDISQDRILAKTWDGSSDCFKNAVAAAKEKFNAEVKVGICNAGVSFAPGPFLKQSTDDLKDKLDSAVQAWDFSQAIIPALLAANGGTLIFTGATMSQRALSGFGALAAGSFARRAIAQALAREFAPQGVHVCHIIVDGLIQTDRVDGIMGKAKEAGTRLEPDDIAKVYLDIINQPQSTWTQELDVRPSKEKW